MEPMKQCPNCGKYVAADKTYCMSCGTTLGVKCPACGKVLPLGAKGCPCGHSFVKSSKKSKKAPSRVLPFVKRYAALLLLVAVAAALVSTVVLTAIPSVGFTLTDLSGREPKTESHTASGFELMGYFLGGHPAGIQAVLDTSAFGEITTPLTLLWYAQGLGWLITLVALVLAALLCGVNARRVGKTTSRRLMPLLLVTCGGGLVVLGADIATQSLMQAAAKVAYATPDGESVSFVWQTGGGLPLAVSLVCIALLGIWMTLHLLSLKEKEDGRAIPLWSILKTPFVLLGKGIRRIFRKRGETGDEERTVICTRRFTVYLILLGVSLIFTQALLSKISHIFFWFMLLLPLPMLLYALVAKSALTVTMISESATTEKNTPYTYEFDIENHSPLAFPFIDAILSIPQSNSVRCTQRTVRLSMAPLSAYHMKNTVAFRFRGTYDIGVKCFYVYDFFRMFRIRVPVSYLTSVYVLPRRLSMDDLLAQAVADSTVRTVSSPLVFDRLEVSDIRDYRMGDSLKSIHWKLSSKAEELIVKEHNTGTSDQTVIFCDMAAHYPDEPPVREGENEPILTPKEKRKAEKKARKAADKTAEPQETAPDASAKADRPAKRGRVRETSDTHALTDEALDARLAQRQAVAEVLIPETTPDGMTVQPEDGSTAPTADVHRLVENACYEDMNEYLADGVVELTVAAVAAELHMGHEVTLLWFDRRADSGIFAYTMKGAEDFERIYRQFATAPLTAAENHVTDLTAVPADLQSAKLTFVVSALDDEMLSRLGNLPCVSDAGSFGSSEVLLYDPQERFMYPQERSAYLEGCRQQLLEVGLTLRVSGMITTRTETETSDSAQGKEE